MIGHMGEHIDYPGTGLCRKCLDEEESVKQGRIQQCLGRCNFQNLECLNYVSLKSLLKFIKNTGWLR